jgi:DNA gyrase subunit B
MHRQEDFSVAKDITEEENYSAASIRVMDDREHVRARPSMYIGSPDIHGLHHLVYEIFDNSVDEAMNGGADYIEVRIHDDNSVTVQDNGRGIPTDIHPTEGRPALEVAMTKLRAGGKFGDGGYKVSGGLHGVGASVVNALSNWMRVEVRRNGTLYYQEYEQGRPLFDMKKAENKDGGRGTTTTFKPDGSIFTEGTIFNYETLAQRFRETAFLTKGLRIKIVDERNDTEQTFYFEGGIVSFVRQLNRNRGVIQQRPFYVDKTVDTTKVEVAVQYNDGYNESVFAFANNINNVDGGTHLTGFRSALTRTINNYARKSGALKEKDENFTGDDIRQGLCAIVSVKLTNPHFQSQTKVKLTNGEVKNIVESVVSEALEGWLEQNPNEARRIMEKCITAQRVREAQSKIKENIVRKGAFDGLTLPGKLADCTEKDAARSEIFIVEGDSAGGTAKQGRDRRFQAILPLRGKILNVERAALDKMLSSNEIKALITALGAGIGDQFELARLRYHRIVIMTDADVDGAHIRTLLLTFFFRNMEEVISNGHLYIAQPPLYRVAYNKQVHYAYNDNERDSIVKRLNTEKANIQRYKGLGEMNAEQLWETTMDPRNRTLLQVTIEDAARADETFQMLMGDEVPPRKSFISTHAKYVKNLDI